MLITLLLSASLCGAASGTSKSASKNTALENLREMADRELTPKQTSDAHSTPSIMMPLQDNYQPKVERQWSWNFEARLVSQRILAPRPSASYGPRDLRDLGALPFFSLSAGAEATLFDENWSLNVVTATTSKKNEGQSDTGRTLSLSAQSFSYGLEASWSHLWSSHVGTSLGYNMNWVLVTQTASAHPLSSWSRQYTEQGPRLAVEYYLSRRERRTVAPTEESIFASSRLSLGYYNRNSEFGSDDSWSLGYGVKW